MLSVCSVCGIADPVELVGGAYSTHASCERLRYGRWYERIGQAVFNIVSGLIYLVRRRMFNA